MNEITEYRELLRDWQFTVAALIVFAIALLLVLFVYDISPVYYQFNVLANLAIFIGVLFVLGFMAMIRCDELRSKISILEQEAGEAA